jgi:dihydropteroate synthase
MVGPSRKSFLGRITGEPVEARDEATAAACAVAAFLGADAVRVHDAAGAARAVAVGRALREAALLSTQAREARAQRAAGERSKRDAAEPEGTP